MLLPPVQIDDPATELPPGVPVSTSTLVNLLGGSRTNSGVRVTENRSLGMPAVWRAVNLIAGTIASLPLHAYRVNGTAREVVTTGQAAELLRNPHPDLTVFELLETMFANQLLWGNAYFLIRRDAADRITGLFPIAPSDVQVGRIDLDTRRPSLLGEKVYAVTVAGAEPLVLGDDDVLHLPAFGYDGICGVSPIRAARQAVGLALAAEEYGARLWGNGSLATGVLQTEQRLTKTQAEDLRDRWADKAGGLANAHQTVVLDKGATWHQLSIPPEDAQFIESRRFQISEIARMFGVPPHMLMDTDKSTSWGSGIEQQTIGFVVYTLRPWLTRVEQRLSRLLRPQPVYARFGLEGLLRGDSAQRAAFYKTMIEIGAFSPNEARAREELAPVEGGDMHYFPLNFGRLGAEPAATDSGQLGQTAEPGPDVAAAQARAAERWTLNLEQPDITVTVPVTVQPADVQVAPIPAPVVNVAPAEAAVNVEVAPASVHPVVEVAPPTVTVVQAGPTSTTSTVVRDADDQIVGTDTDYHYDQPR